jgi:hypothetical protein
MPNQEYLHLDYEHVVQQYPQAVEKVRKWFLGRDDIREGMKQFGTDIEQKAVMERFISMIIQHDPRKLYDPFDALGFKVFITSHPDFDDSFFYYNSYTKNSLPAASRIEAEKAAFMNVFELLEKIP